MELVLSLRVLLLQLPERLGQARWQVLGELVALLEVASWQVEARKLVVVTWLQLAKCLLVVLVLAW
mgnify:CR=1 FL=1